MPDQPDPTLLTAFRFQLSFRRSLPAESGLSGTDRAPVAPPPAPGATATPDARAFGAAGFQECTGLEIEMDVQELLEGGRNDGVIRRVGRAKYQNLVLKRGMFYTDPAGNGLNRELWGWLQSVVSGQRPVVRYDGEVAVQTAAGRTVARWEFERGLPARVVGPALNGRTGEIAIEELHIAHEGLRLA